MIRLSLLFILSMFLMANKCDSKQVKQGIAGQVLWIEGNQMPSIINEKHPENTPDRPAPTGIKREVYIYELTNLGQASSNGPFFSDIQTKLVEKAETDEDGNFAISLPVGTYSVFVKEDEGFFANQMDGQGNINPVEVSQDQITSVTLEINYKAAY